VVTKEECHRCTDVDGMSLLAPALLSGCQNRLALSLSPGKVTITTLVEQSAKLILQDFLIL